MQKTSQSPRRKARRNIQIIVALWMISALLAACGRTVPVELAAGQDVEPVPTPSAASAPVDTLPAESTMTPATASPTQTPEVSALPTATPSPSPTDKEEQPPLLARMLQQTGIALDDVDASQLLMLAYDNGASKLYLYDKDSEDGVWRLTYSFAANVGRNGVTDDKAEGDKKTPTGYYALGFAFGNSPRPDTAWPYRDVTPDSYWVDDPTSASYNTWVEDNGSRDWNSAEHLSSFRDAYAYALVIEYNMHPVVPGKGSAVFLHCGDHPTSGCIAILPADMLTLLKWLKADSNAHILIADVAN